MRFGSRFFLLAISLAAIQLFAQSEVGSTGVNGTITDPSGAIVAGAKVTATNTGTNFTRQTTSTAAGLYSLGNLPVGAYNLKVEMAGLFRPAWNLPLYCWTLGRCLNRHPRNIYFQPSVRSRRVR